MDSLTEMLTQLDFHFQLFWNIHHTVVFDAHLHRILHEKLEAKFLWFYDNNNNKSMKMQMEWIFVEKFLAKVDWKCREKVINQKHQSTQRNTKSSACMSNLKHSWVYHIS